MLHTEVIEVRKVGHADLAERLRGGISDVVGAIDAHHGRGIRIEMVDLSRTLVDVTRGKQVALPQGGIPRVWGDHVRLGISLSWMVSEALHWGDAASIEADLSDGQLLLKVWPRQNPAQAANAMRNSAVPYLRAGANRYQAERAWAEAQGGRLQCVALDGGDPAFFLVLRAVEAFGAGQGQAPAQS